MCFFHHRLSSDYWLGLSDSTLEGHWFWSDGHLLNNAEDWTNWAGSDQPYESRAWGSDYDVSTAPTEAMDCVFTYSSKQAADSFVSI